MCLDTDDEYVAVEIKRVATIEAVEQLTRYLERICEAPGLRALPWGPRRSGGQAAGPDPRRVARDRCVEVDLGVLRGEREPDLTLFAG